VKRLSILIASLAAVLSNQSPGQGTISKPPPPVAVNAQTASYTAVAGDNNKLITMNGANLTLTLPAVAPGPNWAIQVENLASTSVTVSRNGLSINGAAANITLPQFQTIWIWTNGSNYFSSVPVLGSASVTVTPSSTGNTLTSVAGGGTVTTTGSPASGQMAKFSGATSITNAIAKTDYWDLSTFVASGGSHAIGLVPDPGSTAGTTRFLREDSTWAAPPGGGGTTTNSLTFSTGLTVAPAGAFNGATAQTLSVSNPVPANLTLSNPASAATLSIVGGTTVTGPATTDTLVGRATTDTLTNKTLDANATGNTLKRYEYVQLVEPDNGDGTNALRVTTEGATYGHFTFSNSVAKASNFVLYRMRVPDDMDSAVDWACSFSFRLGGADTGSHSYAISMADVAQSAGADLPTFTNEVVLSFAGDASGASGDMEQTPASGYTTLTSWRTSLTAGHIMVIKVARDGGAAGDTSTVNSTDINLTIRYGSSQ